MVHHPARLDDIEPLRPAGKAENISLPVSNPVQAQFVRLAQRVGQACTAEVQGGHACVWKPPCSGDRVLSGAAAGNEDRRSAACRSHDAATRECALQESGWRRCFDLVWDDPTGIGVRLVLLLHGKRGHIGDAANTDNLLAVSPFFDHLRYFSMHELAQAVRHLQGLQAFTVWYLVERKIHRKHCYFAEAVPPFSGWILNFRP